MFFSVSSVRGFSSKRFSAQWAFLFLVFVVLLPSCAPLGREDPDKLLGLALSGIVGADQYTFKGISRQDTVGIAVVGDTRFQGMVKNHDDVYLKILPAGRQYAPPTAADEGWIRLNASEPQGLYGNWNPLLLFAELKQLKKSVERVPNKEVPGADKIRVVLEEEALKKKTVSRLGLELGEHIKQRTAQAKRKYGLSESDALLMQREMAEKTAKWKAQLDEMVNSLRVNGEYVLWIDRKTHLPVRMDVQTVLNYVSGGKKRKETYFSSYEFGDFR